MRTLSVGSRCPAACGQLQACHQCGPNRKGDHVKTNGLVDGGACVDVECGGQGATNWKTRKLLPRIIPNSLENQTTALSLL